MTNDPPLNSRPSDSPFAAHYGGIRWMIGPYEVWVASRTLTYVLEDDTVIRAFDSVESAEEWLTSRGIDIVR